MLSETAARNKQKIIEREESIFLKMYRFLEFVAQVLKYNLHPEELQELLDFLKIHSSVGDWKTATFSSRSEA